MVSECPACGIEFDTERGLKVHHSQIHGEQLPNRGCENCGREFYCPHEKRYCSEKCRSESVSFEGEANPNYRGGMETTECEICEATFEFYPSDKPGVYCPECVENESWREPPNISGSDNPHWRGGTVEADCAMCDTTIERYPSDFAGEVAVCSEACRQAWLSESFTGSGHPNWTGGGNGSYGAGWNQVRKRALERDGYACVACSKTKQAIGRNPDVHHIVPVRAFVQAEDHEKTDAHYLENVVSLCIGCHRKADFGKISRQRLRSLIGDG